MEPRIWTRVISTNEDALVILILVLDIAKTPGDSGQKISLQWRPDRESKCSVLKTQRHTVLIRNANEGTKRLMHEDLPCTGKHLTPTPLAVSDVTFIVDIIESSMRHQMVVPTTEIRVVKASKKFAMLVPSRASRDVRLNCASPGGNHFVEWEDPFSVKPCVVSSIPLLGSVRTPTLSTMSDKQLMQTSSRTAILFNFTLSPIPTKVTHKTTVLGPFVLNVKCLHPSRRDVLPWESKRRVVLKKFLQTIDILRGSNVVDHRQENATDLSLIHI